MKPLTLENVRKASRGQLLTWIEAGRFLDDPGPGPGPFLEPESLALIRETAAAKAADAILARLGMAPRPIAFLLIVGHELRAERLRKGESAEDEAWSRWRKDWAKAEDCFDPEEAERLRGAAEARLEAKLRPQSAAQPVRADLLAQLAESLRRGKRRRDSTPRRPDDWTDWAEPKTLAEYVTATGVNRKTVEKWLAENRATPMPDEGASAPKRGRPPKRYGWETNLAIFGRSISRRGLKPRQRLDLLLNALVVLAALHSDKLEEMLRASDALLPEESDEFLRFADAARARRGFFESSGAASRFRRRPPPDPALAGIRASMGRLCGDSR